MSRYLLLSVFLQAPLAFASFQKTDPGIVSAFLKGQAVEANLFTMEKDPEYQSASLGENAPWSGDFLKGHSGYAANPYADAGTTYPNGRFEENFLHWQSTRFPQLRAKLFHLTDEEIRTLSSAEKYDLLIGSFGSEDSLTVKLWMKALEIISEDENGDPLARKKKMELWTGLCHGYAPVSTILPRPRSTLTLLSVPYAFNGVSRRYSIPFYPDDLKALATVGYAHSYKTVTKEAPETWADPSAVPMVFGRCSGKKPKRDSRGRMIDERCLDTEPGFWHLAATHLLGKRKRSFVIDYDYNDPVNNHPVAGFSLSYFNPLSGKTGSLSESLVDRRGAFSLDLFAAERSPESKWIVGVKMTIQRVGFTTQSSSLTNTPKDDQVKDRTFIYDLELDANGIILGGEWRTAPKMKMKPLLGMRKRKTYPDFIWWVPEDVKPYAWVETGNDGVFDPLAAQWNPLAPIPEELASLAREALKNQIIWRVKDKPEGDKDIHPQIPFQLIEPLMEYSHQQ